MEKDVEWKIWWRVRYTHLWMTSPYYVVPQSPKSASVSFYYTIKVADDDGRYHNPTIESVYCMSSDGEAVRPPLNLTQPCLPEDWNLRISSFISSAIQDSLTNMETARSSLKVECERTTEKIENLNKKIAELRNYNLKELQT